MFNANIKFASDNKFTGKDFLVPRVGFEPTCLAAPAPKAGASAISPPRQMLYYNYNMLEHYTEAFVFNNKTSKEIDAVVSLYTRDFGKVIAKVKSARKITSKLNGHLQPLNFVNARLIEKNFLLDGRQGFQIVDALSVDGAYFKKSFEESEKLLNIAEFINEMTFELHQDLRLWQAIKKIFSVDLAGLEEKIIYRGLLKILGFDPEHASCVAYLPTGKVCGNSQTDYFSKIEHIFLCAGCIGKIDKNQLLLI